MENILEQLILEDKIEKMLNDTEKKPNLEIILEEKKQSLEEERRQKEELQKTLKLGIITLHKSGKSNQEIAYIFGISIEEVIHYIA